ncbi:MAG: hypothetical protein P4M11_13920 [Candidatus Pacebacteria bacterium]|nr:hypothetical protein [Candidatus Paceibacterota bacterium]
MELAYYTSVLPDLAGESVYREKNKPNWTDEDELESDLKTCIAMLGLGVGQCMSAWASGKVGEKLGKRSTMHLNFVISMFALLFTFLVTGISRVLPLQSVTPPRRNRSTLPGSSAHSSGAPKTPVSMSAITRSPFPSLKILRRARRRTLRLRLSRPSCCS